MLILQVLITCCHHFLHLLNGLSEGVLPSNLSNSTAFEWLATSFAVYSDCSSETGTTLRFAVAKPHFGGGRDTQFLGRKCSPHKNVAITKMARYERMLIHLTTFLKISISSMNSMHFCRSVVRAFWTKTSWKMLVETGHLCTIHGQASFLMLTQALPP